jgi:two-component system cell cycle sensor histidine kinase/response regulator CckA
VLDRLIRALKDKPQSDVTQLDVLDCSCGIGTQALGLAARGYTVLEASSGADALEVIEEHGGEIDLVVSDVVMPEMDGPTLLKEIRKRGIEVKVIFMSGYAEDAFKKNLDEGETFQFLQKPFTLKGLATIVKKVMEEK